MIAVDKADRASSECSETATVPNRGCTSGWTRGYRVVSILASADDLREVETPKHQTRAIGELHASKVCQRVVVVSLRQERRVLLLDLAGRIVGQRNCHCRLDSDRRRRAIQH